MIQWRDLDITERRKVSYDLGDGYIICPREYLRMWPAVDEYDSAELEDAFNHLMIVTDPTAYLEGDRAICYLVPDSVFRDSLRGFFSGRQQRYPLVGGMYEDSDSIKVTGKLWSTADDSEYTRDKVVLSSMYGMIGGKTPTGSAREYIRKKLKGGEDIED